MTSASPAHCYALKILAVIHTALIIPYSLLSFRGFQLIIHVGKGEGLRAVKYKPDVRKQMAPNRRETSVGEVSLGPAGSQEGESRGDLMKSISVPEIKLLRSRMISDRGFLLVSLQKKSDLHSSSLFFLTTPLLWMLQVHIFLLLGYQIAPSVTRIISSPRNAWNEPQPSEKPVFLFPYLSGHLCGITQKASLEIPATFTSGLCILSCGCFSFHHLSVASESLSVSWLLVSMSECLLVILS